MWSLVDRRKKYYKNKCVEKLTNKIWLILMIEKLMNEGEKSAVSGMTLKVRKSKA